MNAVNEMPEIMREARVDLGVNGQFSPSDWQAILAQAETRWRKYLVEMGDPQGAWQRVVREFHGEKFWGFRANYRPPRGPRLKLNLGLRLLVMAFVAMVLSIMAVVWTGQTFTFSEEPKDRYLFYAAIAAVVSVFALFLWHSRHDHD